MRMLYAAGRPHPKRESCVRVLSRVADGSLDATVNSEVVQEILYVLSCRGRRDDAITLARHTASLFPDLLPVTRDDLLRACDLVGRHRRLPVRDAIHAATMLGGGLTQIISVDSDFDQIREIRRIDPADA